MAKTDAAISFFLDDICSFAIPNIGITSIAASEARFSADAAA